MNELVAIPTDTLNPETSLMNRTASLIAIIYNKAVELLEEEYKDEQIEFAPWKRLAESERSLETIESLPVDKQQHAIIYHNLIDFKVSAIAESLGQSLRSALSEIIMMRKRRMLKFQNLSGYTSIKEAARKTIPASPTNSTERQLVSFVNNHLDTVEKAGVSEEITITVMSREPKFSVNAARAIARTKSDDELDEQEKLARVRNIMETAASTQYASDIRKEFLNGHYQIPRDIISFNGQQYVTFIPENEDEFLVLAKRTNDISCDWGNAQPILAETQAARTRQETLNDVKIVLSLLMSQYLSLEDIKEYVEHPEDILAALKEIDGLSKSEAELYVLTI